MVGVVQVEALDGGDVTDAADPAIREAVEQAMLLQVGAFLIVEFRVAFLGIPSMIDHELRQERRVAAQAVLDLSHAAGGLEARDRAVDDFAS